MSDSNDDNQTFFDRFKTAWGMKVGKNPGVKMPGTFWTAFCFQHEPDPNRLHVTHKYYDKLSMFESCVIQAAIIQHFRSIGGYQPFTAMFSEREYFGPHNDIAVLLPPDPESFQLSYVRHGYDLLRTRIDMYRHDDWKYSPHVSTDQSLVHGVLDRYVFMHGETPIGVWK